MKKICFLLTLVVLLTLLTGCRRSKPISPHTPQGSTDSYQLIASITPPKQPVMSPEEFEKLIAEVDMVLAGSIPSTGVRERNTDVIVTDSTPGVSDTRSRSCNGARSNCQETEK